MFSFLIQHPDIGLYSSWLFLQGLFGQRNCVRSPHHRGCWKDGFGINTDYEVEIPPGKLIEVISLLFKYDQMALW